MIGDSKYEINFSRKLLLSDWKVAILCKDFANNLSSNVKLSKTQLSKIVQSGELLGKVFALLLKTSLSLMKNVLYLLAKSVLIPLGLIAAAVDTGIHKKKFGLDESGSPSDLAHSQRLQSEKTTTRIINFEIQRYYQNKKRFNGVCSRNPLPKKDETYVKKLLSANLLELKG